MLSFAFAFEKEDEIYQFAIAPPYSVSRLQAYLTAIEMRFPNKFVRTTLGQSLVSIHNFIIFLYYPEYLL